MNKLLPPVLVSLGILLFGITFHYFNVVPNNWSAFFLWIPIFISPVWGIAGLSYLSERSNKE